ncbi:MAG: N-acetylmuramoyl-L-alanine amidase [Akkermansiaceae bacterium]
MCGIGNPSGWRKSAGASWNNATAAKYGILEKDLCLQYSIELAHAIVNDPRAKKLGIMAALTRSDDSHVSAMRRAAIAVHHQASIFLSIHFNGSKEKDAEGTRAYYASEDHPEWEFVHFTNPYVGRDKTFAERLVKDVPIALKPFGGDPSKAKVVEIVNTTEATSKTASAPSATPAKTLIFSKQTLSFSKSNSSTTQRSPSGSSIPKPETPPAEQSARR